MIEPVLTVAQMRAAEEAAIAEGVSAWDLMQRAGHGAAHWVKRVAAGRQVTVLCGPGNNGGDGYVIADYLHSRGHDVKVVAPVAPKTEVANMARQRFQGEVLTSGDARSPVVVDSLFGYGLTRQVEPPFQNLLEQLSLNTCYKIAIDLPSSVSSDAGEALGPLPQFDLTLALGAWKQAHFMMPAMAAMGIRRLVPIGLGDAGAQTLISQPPFIACPPADFHKYKRGLLLVVAGAMPGAPKLAAEAAMRAGAGYVKILSENAIPDTPADLVVEPNKLAIALDDNRVSALLIGPGLGRDAVARGRLEKVLQRGLPTVVDADALHLLDASLLSQAATASLVVTPHEGELAVLCRKFGVNAQSKIERARQLHAATGLTVLAKGADTVLAGPNGIRLFPRGSSWLSIAGTGDVLAGIVASRLAVHAEPGRACEEGVWLQIEAARRASPAFTARQLARSVRPALASFL